MSHWTKPSGTKVCTEQEQQQVRKDFFVDEKDKFSPLTVQTRRWKSK